jgi:hypothetical protein
VRAVRGLQLDGDRVPGYGARCVVSGQLLREPSLQPRLRPCGRTLGTLAHWRIGALAHWAHWRLARAPKATTEAPNGPTSRPPLGFSSHRARRKEASAGTARQGAFWRASVLLRLDSGLAHVLSWPATGRPLGYVVGHGVVLHGAQLVPLPTPAAQPDLGVVDRVTVAQALRRVV